MYATILKIAWPYLQRFLANKTAEYLQERREQRLTPAPAQELESAEQPSVPCYTPEEVATLLETESAPASSGDSIWFALSGVLLGSAFSLMLYVLLNDQERRLYQG